MALNLQSFIERLDRLDFSRMYEGDFFLTWEKTDEELEAVSTIADALRAMRENNISTKIFDSGLGISLFRDNSVLLPIPLSVIVRSVFSSSTAATPTT